MSRRRNVIGRVPEKITNEVFIPESRVKELKKQKKNHSQQTKPLTTRGKDKSNCKSSESVISDDSTNRSCMDKTADKEIKVTIEEQEIIDYFKGKDILKADKLLKDTAFNNFRKGMEAGVNKERIRVKKIVEDMECINKVHKDNPCKIHSKIINADKLLKKLEEKT